MKAMAPRDEIHIYSLFVKTWFGETTPVKRISLYLPFLRLLALTVTLQVIKQTQRAAVVSDYALLVEIELFDWLIPTMCLAELRLKLHAEWNMIG